MEIKKTSFLLIFCLFQISCTNSHSGNYTQMDQIKWFFENEKKDDQPVTNIYLIRNGQRNFVETIEGRCFEVDRIDYKDYAIPDDAILACSNVHNEEPTILYVRKQNFFEPNEIHFLNAIKIAKEESHVKLLYNDIDSLGLLTVADDLNTQKRSLLVDHISRTFMHIPTGRSQWKYTHRIALYSSFKPIGSKVLVLGLGGGLLCNEFLNLGFEVDAVEPDRRLESIAKKHFGMLNEVRVINDNPRNYIKNSNKKYDVIVFNVSAINIQPNDLYTIECFEDIQKIMNNDGVIFLHYQNVLSGEYAIKIKSIGRTLMESGLYTKLINTQPDYDNTSELILFASNEPIDLNRQSFERRDRFADPFNFPKEQGVFIDDYQFNNGHVITDDFPLYNIAIFKNYHSDSKASNFKVIKRITLE